MPRNKLLQIRRGTYSEWASANSFLESGEFGLDTTNNRLKVGPGNWNDLEYLFEDEIIIKIKNVHNTNIRKGQAVYINGEDAGIVTCKPYVADGTISKHFFIGLATTDVAPDEFTESLYYGKISDINTTGSDLPGDLSVGGENWFFGDKLYVSSTNAGKLTKFPQDFNLPVGFVLIAGENTGTIFVNPNIVSANLNNLNDVYLTNIQNNDILKYDNLNNLWKNNDTLDAGFY